ncbi:MAG TPA: glycosyltransferase family 39 protein [Thermoanaerobaculia bacterium]|nr:glycosyltransferase family 39 protein [Thermoanaerobaculia bacterium]
MSAGAAAGFEASAPEPAEETWRGLDRSEQALIIVLSLVGLALRVLGFFRYRFDSDEPQHLHVAWGWMTGLVQYRDLFDNHAPLFHMLTAPLLALVGERPDALLYMRLPMVPLFAVVVAATYVIGRRLYTQRIAIWSALILTLMPGFFLKTLEFRTDNLWIAVWMIALVVLTGGALTGSRIFLIGLILGIAFCVSLKTFLLIITVGGAALITYLLCERRPAAWPIVRTLLVALGGFVIVPAAVAAYFISVGAWKDLVYCNFTFNKLVGETRDNVWLWRAFFPIAMAVLLYEAWSVSRRREFDGSARWRFYFAVALALFLITLRSFWIMISTRDFLPLMPIGAIFLAALVARWRFTRPYLVPILACAGVVCAGFKLHYISPGGQQTRRDLAFTREVLSLTRKGEPIMDLKGESIFRPRPFYNIFEAISRAQMQQGLLRDTIPESMIAARCHVAIADNNFFPPRGRKFLNDNFLNLGSLRASGQWIAGDGSFNIAVEGDYVIVARGGEARGSLDGTPYNGPRKLAAGRHVFTSSGQAERLAVFWAPAYGRGYSPFHVKERQL